LYCKGKLCPPLHVSITESQIPSSKGRSVTFQGVVATPAIPLGPGHTESCPGATARVVRTPGDHLVGENTTVQLALGAPTSSYRRRSPSFCPSRRRLAEFSRSLAAEARAGQPPYITPVSTASAVRQLVGDNPWWMPASSICGIPGRSSRWTSVGCHTPPSVAASW
jgi:hypothetical protein